jgi:hypothetical protein
MLNRWILTANLVLFFLNCNASRGDLLLSETFSTAGSPAPGWSIASAGNGSGMATTGGVLEINTAGTRDIFRTFASQTSGTIYAGYDLVITSAPTDSGDNYFAHFSSNGVANFTSRAFLNLNTGVRQLGISEASGTAVSTLSTPMPLNTRFRVVQAYNITSGIARLWLNPTDESSSSISDATGTNVTTIGAFHFRVNNASDGNKTIDNLLVANTFNEALSISAVPEPTSIALIGLAGCAGLIASYRSRRKGTSRLK